MTDTSPALRRSLTTLALAALITAALLCSPAPAAAIRQAQRMAEPTPFDPTVTRLPPGYAGSDLRGLRAALEARRDRLRKDEFETTAQYRERVRAEEAKPVLGSLRLDSALALVLPASASYNADDEVMNVSTTVPRVTGEVAFTSVAGLNYEAKIKMDIPTARRSKPQMAALVIFNLVEPYLTEGSLPAKPLEVWFYNIATGEVYEKQKQGAAVKDAAAVEAARLLAKARELYGAGQDDEALTELRNVVRIEPNNGEAYLLTGRIYLRRGELASAINQLKTSIFWDRSLVEPHLLLARIYLERGDLSQARAYVQSALQLDPNNPEAAELQRRLR